MNYWYYFLVAGFGLGVIVDVLNDHYIQNPKQLRTNLELQTKSKEKGWADAKAAYAGQLERLTTVLDHIVVAESSVYGNIPPKYATIENVHVNKTHNGASVKGVCRGVEVVYYSHTFHAQVQWHDGCYWTVVSFDLTQPIPAEKIVDLLDFFRHKKAVTKARNK